MRRVSRSALLFVVASLLLATGTLPVQRAWTQKSEATNRQRVTELVQLYQNWQQTQDAEGQITLGEQLVALQADLKSWPPEAMQELGEPELLSGLLRISLAISYVNRARGEPIHNLEKAISHFGDA